MTIGDGLPCIKCKTSAWYKCGSCIQCKREQSTSWAKNNPSKVRVHQETYRNHNRDKLKERETNRDKVIKKLKRIRQVTGLEISDILAANEWINLVQSTGNKCLPCGLDGDAYTLSADHIVPLSKGGVSTIDNIQPLCGSCNSRKHIDSTDFRPSK